jgi:hypothetical protein
MASLRLYDPATQAPTNAAVLLFGLDSLSSIPGAYIQFVRFDGADLGTAVLDAKSLTGNLITQLQELDNLLPIQIRTARVPLEGLRHEEVPDYPLAALRELALNAVMHRSYEGTSAPDWPLAKERRAHVHQVVQRHELPVTHQTRRTGSPYTLVLCKTTALFARDATERKTATGDLAWLNKTARAFAPRQ